MHSYLTIALFALAPNATWESSYTQAQEQATTQQKPLVIMFGPGGNGWTKTVRTDGSTPQVQKLLAEHYVCVYLDTDTAYGQRLAQTFQIQGGVGMVIGDRRGTTQAFWHQGELSQENMTHYLTKYADPSLVVNQTETVRPAYYPSLPAPVNSGRPVNC